MASNFIAHIHTIHLCICLPNLIVSANRDICSSFSISLYFFHVANFNAVCHIRSTSSTFHISLPVRFTSLPYRFPSFPLFTSTTSLLPRLLYHSLCFFCLSLIVIPSQSLFTSLSLSRSPSSSLYHAVSPHIALPQNDSLSSEYLF